MGLAALVKEEDTVNEELKDSTYLGYCVWKHASQPHRGLDIMIFYLSPSSDPASIFTEKRPSRTQKSHIFYLTDAISKTSLGITF